MSTPTTTPVSTTGTSTILGNVDPNMLLMMFAQGSNPLKGMMSLMTKEQRELLTTNMEEVEASFSRMESIGEKIRLESKIELAPLKQKVAMSDMISNQIANWSHNTQQYSHGSFKS